MSPRAFSTGTVFLGTLPLPFCHLGASMLPSRALFYPFSRILGFEGCDSHHPRSTCPESAEGMMRWGSPSTPTPSLWHYLVF